MNTSDANRLSAPQGYRFKQHAIEILKMSGFRRIEDVPTVPVSGRFDCITTNDKGLWFTWEFHGSWRGDRPGCWRLDTVERAFANAYALHRNLGEVFALPHLIMTTHTPQTAPSKATRNFVSTIERKYILDFVQEDDVEMLKFYRKLDYGGLGELLRVPSSALIR